MRSISNLFRLSRTSTLWLFQFPHVPGFPIWRDHTHPNKPPLPLHSSSSSPNPFTSIRSTPSSLWQPPYTHLVNFGPRPWHWPCWLLLVIEAGGQSPRLVSTGAPGSQTRSSLQKTAGVPFSCHLLPLLLLPPPPLPFPSAFTHFFLIRFPLFGEVRWATDTGP